jgi:hypothetical protein
LVLIVSQVRRLWKLGKSIGLAQMLPCRRALVRKRSLAASAVAFGALCLLDPSFRGGGQRPPLPRVSLFTQPSEVPHPDAAKAHPEISLAAARALEAKIQVLSNSDSRSLSSFQPVVITETEANSYLRYRGNEFLPPGVHDPEVHMAPDHVSCVADVDFNELNQAGNKTDDLETKVLAAIFRGKQRVSATGRLETGNGQGKLTIEPVALGTTVIPNGLVNLLLENYLQRRYKFDVSKPFVLPDHVTRVVLGSSSVTLYRSPDKK